MGVFTKGQRADPKALKRVKYPLPEVGKDCYVNIRALTARECQRHLADTTADKPATDYELLSLCLVDDEGSPIFESEDDCREHLDVAAESLIGMVRKLVEVSGIEGPGKGPDRAKN
jgi:hypothetical protein